MRAGRAAVLVNVNDIYAMGGRPLALVNVLAGVDEERIEAISQGIREECQRLQVPMVGGHISPEGTAPFLAASILGRAKALLTDRSAGPGQEILLAVTPKSSAIEGDRQVVRVTATSTAKTDRKDAVKAITILGPGSAASLCHVSSLAALPTRTGAQVTFSLSSSAHVTATVLNVAGRPIKTIAADKPLAAGAQTLLWNSVPASGATA